MLNRDAVDSSESNSSLAVAISIVSWNTCDLLRDCLSSLFRVVNLRDAEVFVVDNASSDGTPEMVRSEFPRVKLVETGANLGFGKAHNLIARHSRAGLIWFLNPDCEFEEDPLSVMVDMLESNPKVGLAGCRMVNRDGSTQLLGFQWHTSPWTELLAGILASNWTMPVARRILPTHDPLKSGSVHKLYGGCLMARREALDALGWFDERFFMYGEDVDLSRRMESAGWQLCYTAGVKVLHLCGGASAKAPGRFSVLMQCESTAKLMAKYYGHSGHIFYTVVVFGRAFLRLSLTGLAMIFGRLGGGARERRFVQSWAKNWMMLKWSIGLERPAIPQ